MSRRVVDLTNDNDQDLFQVTSEWCFAINNIDYIRQSLPSFIKVKIYIHSLSREREREFGINSKERNFSPSSKL